MNRDKVARIITDKLLRIQEGFARYMNGRSAKWSRVTAKIYFSLLCLLFTALSTGFITGAIKPALLFPHATIQYIKPAPLPAPGPVHTIINAAEFAKLQLFRQFMDSLKTKDKFRYKSLLRPGMMDSLELLEKIYLSQLK